ncbi:hypothetical protein HC891_12805 [Candidatus Gracilibacteria bacterium]|nr:hypothetical protein [Candidatus Gracilibacteria bacterium]
MIAVQPLLAAPAIGNSAFQRVWDRQDRAVAERVSDRSWTWGPAPISELVREGFVEGVEGKRTVQYFDKSRMEINDPTADPNNQWYVTNGLLPIELMTGRMQVGLNQFEYQGPARVSAIGDPGQFPTYADLLPVYQSPGTLRESDLNRPATGFLNADGSVTGFNDYANDPATTLLRGENGHGVAKAFIDYMNQSGLVYEGGRYSNGKVYDPLFVFGYPVTGAFWVKAKVGGKEVPILFQVFERRVLTYNPANAAAFRVEMGNVGQHYHQWRYGK